ncbi:hypothetical protein G4B88_023724 [Cannabis sativa]|uniref:Uncharacterized protein n=1 Tax=Cannabis sativa TaxID=3483 RepID=A0A7J6HXK2_CANSA|nr:hypothetical protein G4B88_023724 [Cannabis sativa]
METQTSAEKSSTNEPAVTMTALPSEPALNSALHSLSTTPLKAPFPLALMMTAHQGLPPILLIAQQVLQQILHHHLRLYTSVIFKLENQY